jgi:pantoate--beta-alanine ligase
MMQTFVISAALRQQLDQWRRSGQSIAFVPTMGNLHDGHMALMNHAREQGGRVVASIFINPLQFDDQGDLQRYPVTLDDDRRHLTAARVDALFLPDVGQIYPYGLDRSVSVTVPDVSDCLEGLFRPGHFVGVATVVTKLFNIVRPDIAVFGEKDLQQLLVIRRLVADLCLPIDVQSVATVREPDGMALSSRNGFLSIEQRKRAGVLYRELVNIREQWQQMGARVNPETLERAAMVALERQGLRPEYFSIRSAGDFSVPSLERLQEKAPYYVLAAAWLGDTRLIDNLPL